MFQRRTDYDFWRGLGLRMGQEEMWPWEDLEEAFYYRIYPLGYDASSYDEFVEKYRFHFPEREYYKYGRVGFATPSGRVELVSSTLQELGYPAMPTYVAPVENEVDDPDLAKSSRSCSPQEAALCPSITQSTSRSRNCAFSSMSPTWTSTGNGKGARHLHGRLGVDRDEKGPYQAEGEPHSGGPSKGGRDAAGLVVSGARGRGARTCGCTESNANVLTDVSDAACDPLGGSWANRGLLCRVYKVEQ